MFSSDDEETYDYTKQQPQSLDIYQTQSPQQPGLYPPQQYPQQQGYNQTPYSPYNPPNTPPPKKSSTLKIVIIIIVVIFLLIPIIFITMTWMFVSNLEGEESTNISISARKEEKTEYYLITIATISGDEPNLEDIKLKILDGDGVSVYTTDIYDANPNPFPGPHGKIYALTKGTTVQDSFTGTRIDTNTEFSNYQGCYIAYVDTDSNAKVSPGDLVYIYKDYNYDDSDDLEKGDRFRLTYDDKSALEKSL